LIGYVQKFYKLGLQKIFPQRFSDLCGEMAILAGRIVLPGAKLNLRQSWLPIGILESIL
jgi:hypothetical protein